MHMATPGEKLAMVREAWTPRLKQRELAELLSVPLSRVKSWERAGGTIVSLPKDVAQRIAEIRGFDWLWFYDGTDSPVPGTLKSPGRDVSVPYAPSAIGSGKIPHWGKVPAGDFEMPTHDCGSTEVPAPYSNPDKYVTFTVVNDSMEPTYQPGDLIVVELTKKPVFGRAVVALWEGGLAFKRLKMTKDGPRLVPDNAIYETLKPRDGMEYLGQVVFKMTDQNL